MVGGRPAAETPRAESVYTHKSFLSPHWLRERVNVAGSWLGSGRRAAATVFVPGMAHPIVEDHRAWAWLTMWYVGIVAAARLSALLAGFPRARAHRVLLLTAALIGVLFLQQTAERGARLVYEYGVGVIAAPGSP